MRTESASVPEKRSGLLRNGDFLKLWAGQTVSEFGSWMGALSLFAILAMHASPAQMGLLSACQSLPMMAVALFAGVWADRLRRRPILIFSDLGRAALLLSIPLAYRLGVLSMGQIYGVAACVGTLSVFFNVAYPSYLPSLLEPEELMEGNSRLGVSESIAEVAGAPFGYAVVQKIGPGPGVLVDALSFFVSALALMGIRKPEPRPSPQTERGGIAAEIREGAEAILKQPILRSLTAASLIHSLFGGFYVALYSLYGIRTLGLSPAVLGAVIGLGGAGSLVGAAVAPRITGRLGLGPALCGATLVFGALQAFTPLASGAPARAALFLSIPQLFGDGAITLYMIAQTSIRQSLLPVRVMGRASATVQFLSGLALSAGSLAGGAAAQRIGMRPTFAIVAAGMLLAGIFLCLTPVRRLRDLDSLTVREADRAEAL
jgi:predicted MFS family arabinose efflux permease